MTKRPQSFWNDYFMRMADHTATASKDPSTQVGCVLVDDKRRIVGMGYNGFPRGVDDKRERLLHRPTKYLMVQHAEVNAVLNAVAGTRDATAYVTHRPCASCSGILIQAGVRKIVTRKPEKGFAERFAESFAAADAMLSEAGVELEMV